jgi:nicotinamidase-related amidase
MCGVCLHSFCVAETNREIEALGAEVILGENLCSVSCYRYHKSDSLTADAVKAELSLLMKKNKEQLKKEAREFNIKVNNRVNGASMICQMK